MLGYVRGTTTETGLEVKATLVEQEHKKGISVPDIEVAMLVIYPKSYVREGSLLYQAERSLHFLESVIEAGSQAQPLLLRGRTK